MNDRFLKGSFRIILVTLGNPAEGAGSCPEPLVVSHIWQDQANAAGSFS